MRVFAQGAASGAPLGKGKAFTGNEDGWNLFMMAGDPYKSGVAAVQDQASGRVAGYTACGGGTSFDKLWENDDITYYVAAQTSKRHGSVTRVTVAQAMTPPGVARATP